EEKGRYGTEALEQVREYATRAWQCPRKLGNRQGSEDGNHATQHPAKQYGTRVVQFVGDSRRYAEDTAADRNADEHRHCVEETDAARKPLPPTVSLDGQSVRSLSGQ